MERDLDEQGARGILLKYYSSECTIHGTYIVSLFIGLFTFMQIRDSFAKTDTLLGTVAFALLLSIFPISIFYCVARTVVWGTMAGLVIHVRPVSQDEAETRLCTEIRRGWVEATFLLRLHLGCCDSLMRHHWFWGMFLRERKMSGLVVLIVSYLACCFVVYYWIIPAIGI
jgi:hypothetical protein